LAAGIIERKNKTAARRHNQGRNSTAQMDGTRFALPQQRRDPSIIIVAVGAGFAIRRAAARYVNA